MPRAIPVADPIDVYVGAQIRAGRLARGMPQGELGAALNVAFQQVQKYESGVNRVSASMLAKVAEALEMSVQDFFPPAKTTGRGDRPVDISGVRGGADLSKYFAAMSAGNRQTLLKIARALVSSEGADGDV